MLVFGHIYAYLLWSGRKNNQCDVAKDLCIRIKIAKSRQNRMERTKRRRRRKKKYFDTVIYSNPRGGKKNERTAKKGDFFILSVQNKTLL